MISRILKRLLVLAGGVCLAASFQPVSAQGIGEHLDFGVLETGVLPDGTELPDLTGDTLDPNSPPQPKRAQALPPPADFYDAPDAPVKKKGRKAQH